MVSDAEKASVRSEKLRFGKAEISVEQVAKPSRAKRLSTKGSSIAVSSQVHRQIAQNEDENVGVQSAHQSEELAETAIHTVEHAGYSKKIKAYNKAERLEKRADKANVDALYENQRVSNPDSSTNPISCWRQEKTLLREVRQRPRVQKKPQRKQRKLQKEWQNLFPNILMLSCWY